MDAAERKGEKARCCARSNCQAKSTSFSIVPTVTLRSWSAFPNFFENWGPLLEAQPGRELVSEQKAVREV